MNNQTLGITGVVFIIICVFILILSLVTCITGTLWITKVSSEDLHDTYNVIMYATGDNVNAVTSYIQNNPLNKLSSQQLTMAIKKAPAIIFQGVTPAQAEEIVTKIRGLGGVADAL